MKLGLKSKVLRGPALSGDGDRGVEECAKVTHIGRGLSDSEGHEGSERKESFLFGGFVSFNLGKLTQFTDLCQDYSCLAPGSSPFPSDTGQCPTLHVGPLPQRPSLPWAPHSLWEHWKKRTWQ